MAPRGRRRRFRHAPVRNRCRFTPRGSSSPSREDIWPLDYKNLDLLNRFMTSQAKIYSAKRSGNSVKAQAQLKSAVKNARYMALLPYVGE